MDRGYTPFEIFMIRRYYLLPIILCAYSLQALAVSAQTSETPKTPIVGESGDLDEFLPSINSDIPAEPQPAPTPKSPATAPPPAEARANLNPSVVPPPATAQIARDRGEVERLAAAGNTVAAREYALAALEKNPKDPALLSFIEFTAPARAGIDLKTVNKRIAELMAGMRSDDGTVLASPISFAALPSASARGPATASPAELGTVSAIRNANVLRDAASKIAIKDYASAESALTRHIAEVPGDSSSFRLRALARRLLRRYADSIADAKRALALEPRDARSLRLLSRNLTDLGRPQEALVEADRALALNNKDAPAYLARAAALSAMGRGAEELADLARAAAFDSQFDALYQGALAARGGGAPSARRGPVWFGATAAALLFFSFALFHRRDESSVRLALRKEDHEVLVSMRAEAEPKGFRIMRTLGSGGMGIVYEAIDLSLQRTVALKKLHPEVAGNPRERARFIKEARTVAVLKHPHIVEIHAICEEAKDLFLVFERVPGESLSEKLGRGPVKPVEAVVFLRQIASALDYAHGQGIVHQDLKPGNVMINGGMSKVMDFGIARRVQEVLSTLSKIEIAGTPAYMSPEQEQGVVTPSADVYALGVCAYEILAGARPFPTGGLMLKAQNMYRLPSAVSPGLNTGVDTVIARALAPRPEDRWPTAGSFVDALVRAL